MAYLLYLPRIIVRWVNANCVLDVAFQSTRLGRLPTMSNFSDLPNELIWHTATYLVTPFGQCCSDIAALALTNRRFHSVLNVLLYQVGADYVAPLFWAAQNGRADTLRNLLQTGLRDIGEEEWITEGAVFPTAYKVGRLAGRYRSLNVSSGVFNDDDQRIGTVSLTRASKTIQSCCILPLGAKLFPECICISASC